MGRGQKTYWIRYLYTSPLFPPLHEMEGETYGGEGKRVSILFESIFYQLIGRRTSFINSTDENTKKSTKIEPKFSWIEKLKPTKNLLQLSYHQFYTFII